MAEFKGQYYCDERNKYHLEYQGEHYYFDTIRQANDFMDSKCPPVVREVPKEKSYLFNFLSTITVIYLVLVYAYCY